MIKVICEPSAQGRCTTPGCSTRRNPIPYGKGQLKPVHQRGARSSPPNGVFVSLLGTSRSRNAASYAASSCILISRMLLPSCGPDCRLREASNQRRPKYERPESRFVFDARRPTRSSTQIEHFTASSCAVLNSSFRTQYRQSLVKNTGHTRLPVY